MFEEPCRLAGNYRSLVNTVAIVGRVVARVLLICAIVVHFSVSAQAIMATPTDKYEEAPAQVIEVLRSLEQTADYLQDASQAVQLMRIGTETETLYFFVRLETSECKEWCPNAVFKNEVSSEGFVAFVVLPRKSTWGDVIRSPCWNCDPVVSLIFYDDEGNEKSIAIDDDGLIF
jgi:hypothetical protein